MTHTSNLNLPQWDRTDRIMMDDFNSAMANIDSGVAGRCGHAQLLKTADLSVPSSTDISIDLSGISWGDWEAIILVYECSYTPVSSNNATISLTVPGATRNYCAASDSYFLYSNYSSFCLTFLTWHDATRNVRAIHSGEAGYCIANTTFETLENITARSSGSHPATAHTEIWGIR